MNINYFDEQDDEGKKIIPPPNLNTYEKELILRMAQDHDCLQDYDEWVSMMDAFKSSGFSIEDVKRISKQDPETQKEIEYKWNGLKGISTFGSIVHNIVPQWNNLSWRFQEIEKVATDFVLDKFSHLHKILVGSGVYIADETTKERGVLRDKKNTYDCYSGNEDKVIFPVDVDWDKNKIIYKKVDGFPIWFKNALLCQTVVCNPEKEFGEIKQDGELVFNDWEEPEISPIGDGTPSLFWSHLFENVCDYNEECFKYFQMWIYDLIANPLHRNGIAIAISGDQGCGKSVCSKVLSMFFHPKYCFTINTSAVLQNKFNPWVNSIICSLEESSFAGERKNGIFSMMKDLITSETTTVERKYVDTQRIQNKLHFIINSNEEFIVPKQFSDRRYFVLRCNNNRRNDRKFFKEMINQMENGGAYKMRQEAMAHKQEALNFDFTKIPKTEIGVENMLESSPMLLRYLIDCIEEYIPNTQYDWGAFWDDGGRIVINASKLLDKYNDKKRGDAYLTNSKVGKLLTKWTGKESRQTRVVIRDYPENKIKNLYCFVFCSIDELKCSITEHYFGGQSPFTKEK